MYLERFILFPGQLFSESAPEHGRVLRTAQLQMFRIHEAVADR
jgi:hypothetical protein